MKHSRVLIVNLTDGNGSFVLEPVKNYLDNGLNLTSEGIEEIIKKYDLDSDAYELFLDEKYTISIR